ncbi:MAG: hypothetical protein A2909_02515 [Candidatus Tagabacteria bacterium RIFCSPLOWO2_01_FULL_39_11]|uniref:Uncharacterized protein n=1 Tax=Candidatus Tagabacteria bacterium RIFCSPLOWO2_01_FULL_39_11 TaxID=1802295 RepID=A0A1G2LRT6_9BACT|nr:MAG: hypothetical protein A2909_02515 [Candidatus Tagabacteria bacterium RIFCSPLOWO2_01_FULL_39_11]
MTKFSDFLARRSKNFEAYNGVYVEKFLQSRSQNMEIVPTLSWILDEIGTVERLLSNGSNKCRREVRIETSRAERQGTPSI